ncbi:hydroxyethylthiazole kinase family protein, partial [Vibrio parahaemolyticus V-223/04]
LRQSWRIQSKKWQK